MKVVSLLPSATEILCALGLEESIVAVSHSCEFSGRIEGLPRVTGTRVPREASSREIDRIVREHLDRGESLYAIDVELLCALEPDLVVTQDLCEVCAVAENEVGRALRALRVAPQVVTLGPRTVDEVMEAILAVGRATGRAERARRVVGELRARIVAVYARTAGVAERPRVGFLEWLDPPMCGGHWNPELVHLAGGIDGIGKAGQASRTIAWEELLAWRPEVLCVACCGYSVERTREEVGLLFERPGFAELPCARSGWIHLFDGIGLFSRPGPRLVDSLELLAGALHPELSVV